MAETKKLTAALLAAQQHLRAIDRDGRGNRGEYVSVDAAVANARDALARAELVLFQVSSELEMVDADSALDRDTGEVKTEKRLILRRRFILSHSSGESLELAQAFPVRLEKRTPIDHAVAAADSFGLTYLLRGLLLFARGDDFDTSDRHSIIEAPREERAEHGRNVTRAARELESTVDGEPGARWMDRWRWEAPSVDDLEAFEDGDEVPRELARDLHGIAVAELGEDFAANAWRDIGAKRDAPITGRMARLYAAAIIAAL